MSRNAPLGASATIRPVALMMAGEKKERLNGGHYDKSGTIEKI